MALAPPQETRARKSISVRPLQDVLSLVRNPPKPPRVVFPVSYRQSVGLGGQGIHDSMEVRNSWMEVLTDSRQCSSSIPVLKFTDIHAVSGGN